MRFLKRQSGLHRRILVDQGLRGGTQPDGDRDCPGVRMAKHTVLKVAGPPEPRLHLGRCFRTELRLVNCA
jgi:hypothetical protein